MDRELDVRIRHAEGTLHVDGALTLASVGAARAAANAAGQRAPHSVDLGGVSTVDSAAVALLVAWRRDFGQDTKYRHPPAALRVLANLSGVNEWLFGAD